MCLAALWLRHKRGKAYTMNAIERRLAEQIGALFIENSKLMIAANSQAEESAKLKQEIERLKSELSAHGRSGQKYDEAASLIRVS